MSEPLFSFVIPSFNSERFIRATLDSVLGQTYPNFEIIVIDGHSNDETLEIVKSYAVRDSRVRYALQTGDRGPARARNQGFELSRGAYVSFLDSDNILSPRACEIVRQRIDNGGGCDIYFSGMRYFEGERPERLMRFTVQSIVAVTLAALIRENFINLLGTFIRRDLLDKVGGFDDRFRTCEEYILWLRLALLGEAKFEYISDVLGYLRFHDTNLTWRPSYFVEAAETNFVVYAWLAEEITKRFSGEYREQLLAILASLRRRWLFRAILGGIIMRDRALAGRYLGRWSEAAGHPAILRYLAKTLLALVPLRFASPILASLRRRFVMRRYVPAEDSEDLLRVFGA